MKKRGLALILAAALLLGAVPVPPARADAAAGDTIGGADTALIYADPAAIPETTRTALYAAIQPVENCILVYGSGTDTADYAVCDAVWSCSGGYNTQTGVYGTCAGLDAWGTDTPYLQSVRSPYERTCHEKLRSSIGRDYTYQEANDSKTGQPYQSADTSHKSLGGYVQYGTLVSNGVAYLYLNQFVSSRYCFDFDAGAKIMDYYGWGHGVGMTQCGAVGYAAEEGYNWMQILAHYYTGTSIYRQDTAALRVICDKATDSAYARGDVDRDGAVTVRDALLCACCLAGRLSMDAGQNALGDVNGDGTMDAADLAGIARLLTGSAAG
jgi:SpoIID/LytB domain protein